MDIEKLAEITKNGFDAVNERLDAHEQRFAAIEERLTQIEANL